MPAASGLVFAGSDGVFTQLAVTGLMANTASRLGVMLANAQRTDPSLLLYGKINADRANSDLPPPTHHHGGAKSDGADA